MIPRPMLAMNAVSEDLSRPDMSAERKYDGTRVFIIKNGSKVQLIVARGSHKDYASHYPSIVSAARKLHCQSCILDGEFVFFDKRGTDVFLTIAATPQRIGSLKYKVMAFDLLNYNGTPLDHMAIEHRKKLLNRIVPNDLVIIKEVDIKRANKMKYFKQITSKGGEGIVLKEDQSLYHPGKNREWLKYKKTKELDVIVKGFTPGTGSRRAFFGALQCYYPFNSLLTHVCDVGSGFDLTDLKQITPIAKMGKPFVIQVRYMEMSASHHMRFPVFERLRQDKSVAEVMRG